MVEVLEFKGLRELNEYLEGKNFHNEFEIKPVARIFEHPETKLIVNSITYILIIG